MKKTPTLALLLFGCCAAGLLAQNSPAPDGPAEGPLRANPGTTAAGVHPPSPMDGHRFAPGPPPPMPGTEETPPGGRVKTEEKLGTPVPTAAVTAAPAPAITPTLAAPAATPKPTPKARKTKKPAIRRATTPAAAAASPAPTPR